MPTHLLLRGSTPWLLNGFYDPPESSLDVLAKAGASTIEVSDFILTPEIIDNINRLRLSLIIQAYPESAHDIEKSLAFAKQTRAIAINAHVRTPHLTHSESAELVKGLLERADGAGVPLYIETHRGCVTQDLYRTAQLVDAVPAMKFTLDVSHYVLCEEQTGPTPKLASLLDGILDRTEMIHGRICNGQQIQEHTIDASSNLAQVYKAFWTEAMRRWRLRKPAGSSLIFTPELGPPPYAVLDSNGRELSDRLKQTEVIWEIAQAAWKDSVTAGRNTCWPV